MNKSEDYIYFNSILHNTNPFVIPCSILDVRDRDILARAENYEMSIIRFTIPTNLLPLLIVPNGLNIYSVTLSYGNTDYQQFLPYTQTSFRNLYGRGTLAYYDYQTFLDDLNSALSLSFTDLIFNNPACVATNPPRFYYDSNTKLISCYIDRGYVDNTVGGVNMWMNTILFNLLQSFNVEYFITPQPTGKDVRFIINDSNILSINNILPRVNVPNAISNTPGTLYQLQQTYICISNFHSVRSIVITTGLLPVMSEYLPNISSNIQNQNVSNNNRAIISDFEIPSLTDQDTFRTSINYLPTAEYRMISLLGNQSINKIDLKVYFTDENGNFYDLFLDVNKTMSIKILFRQKK